MEDGHAKSVEEVINYYGTDPERGLSPDQVKRNQEKYGPNGMYLQITSITIHSKSHLLHTYSVSIEISICLYLLATHKSCHFALAF